MVTRHCHRFDPLAPFLARIIGTTQLCQMSAKPSSEAAT